MAEVTVQTKGSYSGGALAKEGKYLTFALVHEEHGFGQSDEAFHKIVRGEAAAKQKAAVKPSGRKAIPLDQDDDLKEFNG